MKALLIHEFRLNKRNLIIWLLCVGGMSLSCILLFNSVKDTMKDMADAFASMGPFSAAIGMDRLSIATLSGYYGTEICVIHSLGGAMFAAILGCSLLAREEEGHTGEFLYTLPLGRRKTTLVKWLVLVLQIILFQLVCTVLYAGGFLILGEEMDWQGFLLTTLAQLVMFLEVGSVCFLISACSKKSKIGIGLGMVLFLYAVDIMARIIPVIKGIKYVSPFFYSNATDILSDGRINGFSLGIGLLILIASIVTSFILYEKKDLAS